MQCNSIENYRFCVQKLAKKDIAHAAQADQRLVSCVVDAVAVVNGVEIKDSCPNAV